MLKAQFASVEATLSLLVVLLAIGFASRAVTNYNKLIYTSKLNLSESLALYDIEDEILQNTSANNCVSGIIENQICAHSLLSLYGSVYDVKIKISSQGKSVGYATGGRTICFAVNFTDVCITAGS